MASIATIQIAQDRLTVKAGNRASFSFTATNTFGSDMDMAADCSGKDKSTKSWCSIGAPVERTLRNQGTDTFVANIQIPEDAQAGEYQFSLLLYSVENPNLDYSTSDPVVVVVEAKDKAPEPKKQSKWWIWLIVAVVVLAIVGGIIAILAIPDDKPVEDPCNVHWTKKPLDCKL